MDAETKELLKTLIDKVDRLEKLISGGDAALNNKYPRQVMRLKELEKLGFERAWLLRVYRIGNRKVAWKASNASNSPILYDTYELEKVRKAQCVGR